MAPPGRLAPVARCSDRPPRQEPRPPGAASRRGAGGGTRPGSARLAGTAFPPRPPGPRRERRLGGQRRAHRRSSRAEGGDRRRHHDLAARLGEPRRRCRQAPDPCSLGGRPPRLDRVAPATAPPDPRRASSRPPRRPPCRCGGHGLRRHRRGDADARAAAAPRGDRQRVRLRGLRGARVSARRPLTRHARRELLWAPRSPPLPGGTGEGGWRRHGTLRRRLPERLPRVRPAARARRSHRGRVPPFPGGGARAPARLRRAPAPYPRERAGRPLRKGVRVSRRRAADPRGRPARRGGCGTHPRHRRRHRRRSGRRGRDGGSPLRARRAPAGGNASRDAAPPEWRDRLSRRARAREFADLLEAVSR